MNEPLTEPAGTMPHVPQPASGPAHIGPYAILEKLGAGGMGTVYLGRHTETEQLVAIKVLPAALAREEGFVERFNREIESMRKLNSPYIVKLFDHGVEGETYYYTMEYVPGETVLALLKKVRRLPWQHATELVMQVCHALKAAHDSGIIHRDLKPSNLLLTPDGQIKLTDFGVAQVFATDRLTVTGGIIGTAEYMSPEQAQGKRATRQSDLYSLGAVYYVLVTGRPPFAGGTAIDVIQKHKFGQFDKPSNYVPDLPKPIEDIICQLLEKDPSKRFPDAYVLLRRLEQVVQRFDVVMERTLAENADDGPLSTTSSSGTQGPRTNGPGPATFMRELFRAESRHHDEHWLQRALNSTVVLVLLLVTTVGGAGWWVWSRSMTDDERYAAGLAILDQPPGLEWLRARDDYFLPLLEKDRDRWETQVTPQLDKIEFYELTRPLGRLRARLPAQESAGSSSAREAERFLRLARREEDAGDEARALRRLAAVEVLLAGDEEQVQLLEVTRKYRQHLERQQSAERLQWIEKAQLRAQLLSQQGRTNEARQVWEAIVQLYDGDREALEHVRHAQAALARLPSAPSGSLPGSLDKPAKAGGQSTGSSPPASPVDAVDTDAAASPESGH